jgi:hypothetical protein
VEHHTIRTAPSIQVLHLTHQQRQQRQQSIEKALVVGNPTLDLPAAKREAKAVARLFNTRPLIGKRATEATVVERMPDAHLIHLAAHAKPTAVDENYGGSILLADPTQGSSSLTTNEILEMQLQAELVVLSGCNTGVSEIINSDGVVGLARSIMAAGTPSVIMSLWQVPDDTTALLMQKFYRYWYPTTHTGVRAGAGLALLVFLGVLWLTSLNRSLIKLKTLSQIQWREILPSARQRGFRQFSQKFRLWRSRAFLSYQNQYRKWMIELRSLQFSIRTSLYHFKFQGLRREQRHHLATQFNQALRNGIKFLSNRKYQIQLIRQINYRHGLLLATIALGVTLFSIGSVTIPAPQPCILKSVADRPILGSRNRT